MEIQRSVPKQPVNPNVSDKIAELEIENKTLVNKVEAQSLQSQFLEDVVVELMFTLYS